MTPDSYPGLVAICLVSLTQSGEELGRLECLHIFHLECVTRWCEVTNSCPLDRSEIHHVNVMETLEGNIIRVVAVDENRQRVSESYLATHEEPEFGECLVCGLSCDEDLLLICDQCETYWHTYCLGLTSIPDGEWFCPHCRPEVATVSTRVSTPTRSRRSTTAATQSSSSVTSSHQPFVRHHADRPQTQAIESENYLERRRRRAEDRLLNRLRREMREHRSSHTTSVSPPSLQRARNGYIMSDSLPDWFESQNVVVVRPPVQRAYANPRPPTRKRRVENPTNSEAHEPPNFEQSLWRRLDMAHNLLHDSVGNASLSMADTANSSRTGRIVPPPPKRHRPEDDDILTRYLPSSDNPQADYSDSSSEVTSASLSGRPLAARSTNPGHSKATSSTPSLLLATDLPDVSIPSGRLRTPVSRHRYEQDNFDPANLRRKDLRTFKIGKRSKDDATGTQVKREDVVKTSMEKPYSDRATHQAFDHREPRTTGESPVRLRLRPASSSNSAMGVPSKSDVHAIVKPYIDEYWEQPGHSGLSRQLYKEVARELVHTVRALLVANPNMLNLVDEKGWEEQMDVRGIVDKVIKEAAKS
ncbi:hypothetical protein HDU85_006566 [Gaertneriomyces sp. JEL0708]|nr:hypothetical protein HDU85_006566 [Gaertneriomyces sp. JEL0708]